VQIAGKNLAPLQRVMLRDTLAAPSAGQHVEQVEICFCEGVASEKVERAWRETEKQTEALRMGVEDFEVMTPLLEPWETWLELDRAGCLLGTGQVPWRVKFWPDERRFLWTVHHALLDGRSLTRVVRAFLRRVSGEEGGELALARWQAPTPGMIALAVERFGKTFAADEAMPAVGPLASTADPVVVRKMGVEFAQQLAVMAAAIEVTPATVVIWAWGQALLRASGGAAVGVEQVRAGAPQPGTAGFTMNLLPLRIRRGHGVTCIQEFRQQMLGLRDIETVSEPDFPQGVFPRGDTAWSSVIMVEHTAFEAAAEFPSIVKSHVLHESRCETLAASAHLLPDLQLQVEGPGQAVLLDCWAAALTDFIREM
jgi:hypothetical protein